MFLATLDCMQGAVQQQSVAKFWRVIFAVQCNKQIALQTFSQARNLVKK